jgi:hypothetical protein
MLKAGIVLLGQIWHLELHEGLLHSSLDSLDGWPDLAFDVQLAGDILEAAVEQRPHLWRFVARQHYGLAEIHRPSIPVSDMSAFKGNAHFPSRYHGLILLKSAPCASAGILLSRSKTNCA